MEGHVPEDPGSTGGHLHHHPPGAGEHLQLNAGRARQGKAAMLVHRGDREYQAVVLRRPVGPVPGRIAQVVGQKGAAAQALGLLLVGVVKNRLYLKGVPAGGVGKQSQGLKGQVVEHPYPVELRRPPVEGGGKVHWEQRAARQIDGVPGADTACLRLRGGAPAGIFRLKHGKALLFLHRGRGNQAAPPSED